MVSRPKGRDRRLGGCIGKGAGSGRWKVRGRGGSTAWYQQEYGDTHHKVPNPAVFGVVNGQLLVRDVASFYGPDDAIRQAVQASLHIGEPLFPVAGRVAEIGRDCRVEADEHVEQVLHVQKSLHQ